MEATKFDIAAFLSRTPEQVEEDLEAQAAAEARLASKVTDSPAVATYRNHLGSADDDERTAEQLFWRGKFAEAAEKTSDPAKKAEFQEFADAFSSEVPVCNCPPIQFRSQHSAKGHSVPARREIQHIFVEDLGKEVSFIKCEACKRLFATR